MDVVLARPESLCRYIRCHECFASFIKPAAPAVSQACYILRTMGLIDPIPFQTKNYLEI